MELTDCYLPKGHVSNQRYEVFDVIGSGGFGIIYRAFDLLLNRFVAVKEFVMSLFCILKAAKPISIMV